MKRVILTFLLIISILCYGCSKLENAKKSSAPTENIHDDAETALDSVDKYYNVPEEYRPILADYETIVKFRLSDTFETEYNSGYFPDLSEGLTEQLNNDRSYGWGSMIADMLDYLKAPTVESFGYILVDLDGDNDQELIWVSSDYKVVFAIFTIHNNEAKLLDAYWPKYKAMILDSSEIYTLGVGGATTFEYVIYELDNGELKPKHRFGCDDGDFYEIVDDEIVEISEENFERLLFDTPFEFGESWENKQIYLLTE